MGDGQSKLRSGTAQERTIDDDDGQKALTPNTPTPNAPAAIS